ncbi:MAG: cytochrome-c peroxidase, partial [Pseudopedobacter saltans]
RANGLEAQASGPITNLHEMGSNFPEIISKLKNYRNYNQLFKNAFGDDQITQTRIVNALAQFERTLISCNSNYDKYLAGKYSPTISEKKGMDLFFGNGTMQTLGCSHCHGGPKTYEELFADNGLNVQFKDSGRYDFTHQNYDIGRFRTVTLRNIALTAPYMHDGRFKTLEEVISHYSDHVVDTKSVSSFLRHVNKEDKMVQLNLNNVGGSFK